MFKAPFSFNGRIKRKEYCLTFIIRCAVYLFVVTMNEQTHTNLWALIYFPSSWFLFAQGAKRCHDLGKSGWWQIIPFYFLWMMFQDGQRFTNEYDIAGDPFYGADDYEKPFSIDPDITPVTVPVIDNNGESHPEA